MSGLLHAAGPPMAGPIRTQVPEIACSVVPGVRDACLLADVASEAGNSVIDGLGGSLLSGLATLLRMGMTWWTTFPSPQMSSSAGQPAPVLTQIREYTSGLQVVLLTAGIIFAAARLALAKRGGVAGEAQETFLMFARAIFAAMTFATLVTVGTRAGDEFSNWVIFDATRGDLENSVARLLDPEIMANLGPGILLVVGAFGVISMIIQLVMLVVRQALLVVVVAVIPLAASASGTAPGSQAYKRLLSWSLAFVLWKPVGALVYAIAFTVVGSDDQTDPQLMLLGLILMLMSVIVLPALIRLIAPAVATLGGGGGATSVLAGAGVGIGMSAAGSRPTARRMTEGENSATPAGSAPGSNRSPSGGSTARPMTPVSASGGSASPSGSAGQAPSSPAAAGAGGTSAAAGSAVGAGAGKASGAMAAGPAGAAMLGAQLAVGALQGIASTAQTAVPESSSAQIDPDALGPGEIRR